MRINSVIVILVCYVSIIENKLPSNSDANTTTQFKNYYQDDDANEKRRFARSAKQESFHPYRKGSSIPCLTTNPNILIDNQPGHTSCLQSVRNIARKHVQIYFDQYVDQTEKAWKEVTGYQPYLQYYGKAKWLFEFTPNVWHSMTSVYGSFGSSPILRLVIHGHRQGGHEIWQHQSFHQFSKLIVTNDINTKNNFNILDLTSTTKDEWVSEEKRNQSMDLIINQLFLFVENKFKNSLGALLSAQPWNNNNKNDQSNFTNAWRDIFTIDIYNSISKKGDHAQRYEASISSAPAEHPNHEKGNLWFHKWFLPIYTNYSHNNNNVLHSFFQLIQNHMSKSKAAKDNNYTLDLGGFVFFWSGAAKFDLRSFAHNSFGWNNEYQMQFQNTSNKFARVAEFFKAIEFKFPEDSTESNPPDSVTTQNHFEKLGKNGTKNENESKSSTLKPGVGQTSNNPGPSNKDNSEAYRMYIIVGSGVGSFIILLLVVVLILSFIFYKKKIQNLQSEIRALTNDEVKEFFEGDANLPEDDAQALVLSMPFIKDFEIPREKLILDTTKVLGSGQFGTVIHGFVQSRDNYQLMMSVAVKTVKPDIDIACFKSFLSEVKIMAYLREHENIVGLLGTCTGNIKNREIFIALEFCPLGNIGDYLKNIRENAKLENTANNGNSSRDIDIDIPFEGTTELNIMELETIGDNLGAVPSPVEVLTSDLIKWSHEIANAMMYLTQKKVIHGDLAARNILLTDSRVAKISDFGLSRQFLNYANYMKTSKIPVPWRWLAIESLKEMKFSTASDVWAFGVTMWEIFSLAEIPYGAWTYDLFFVDRLIAGDRLQRPFYAKDAVYEIMKACWEAEPAQRPTFSSIYNRLGEFISIASEIDKARDCEWNENQYSKIAPTSTGTASGVSMKINVCETKL